MQMQACNFIEIIIYSGCAAQKKLDLLQKLFSSTSSRDVSRTPLNIYDGEICKQLTAKKV